MVGQNREKTVTFTPKGVNQSFVCGFKLQSQLLNCHLATGRIGKEGYRAPFPIDGPNQMPWVDEKSRGLGISCRNMTLQRQASGFGSAVIWQAPNIGKPENGLTAVDLFQR